MPLWRMRARKRRMLSHGIFHISPREGFVVAREACRRWMLCALNRPYAETTLLASDTHTSHTLLELFFIKALADACSSREGQDIYQAELKPLALYLRCINTNAGGARLSRHRGAFDFIKLLR